MEILTAIPYLMLAMGAVAFVVMVRCKPEEHQKREAALTIGLTGIICSASSFAIAKLVETMVRALFETFAA